MGLPTVLKSTLDVRPIANNYPARFMNPGELEVVVALVRSVHPYSVLEIGVNTGRTARVILDNVPGIVRYEGVDVEPGYVPSKRVQLREVPTPDEVGMYVKEDYHFTLILRPRGSLDLTVDDLRKCDAAFIDGDHGREAVNHDTMLARQLVKPGGIIIWHDYHSQPTVDVKPLLDHWFYADGAPIYHVEGTWIAFERIPR